jgi:hypothetical protein
MARAERFVIRIEKIKKACIEGLVTRDVRRQHHGLEKPAGMGQVPFGWACVGHRLDALVFRRQRSGQRHGMSTDAGIARHHALAPWLGRGVRSHGPGGSGHRPASNGFASIPAPPWSGTGPNTSVEVPPDSLQHKSAKLCTGRAPRDGRRQPPPEVKAHPRSAFGGAPSGSALSPSRGPRPAAPNRPASVWTGRGMAASRGHAACKAHQRPGKAGSAVAPALTARIHT